MQSGGVGVVGEKWGQGVKSGGWGRVGGVGSRGWV